MIKKSFILLLALNMSFAAHVLAEQQKPLALKNGRMPRIQDGDMAQADAPTTLATSGNISRGIIRLSPNYKILWPTAIGINGTTITPFTRTIASRKSIDHDPIFSNDQYDSGFQFLSNGARPDLWYNRQQKNSYATDALTSAILVPSSATVHQTNGIASYVYTMRAQSANGGDVAAYFQGQCAASNCAVFSLNTVAADSIGMTGQKIGVEIDNNVNASDTIVNGINLVLSGNLTMSGYANGYTCRIGYGMIQWNTCLNVDDGSISAYPILIGSVGKGNGVDSMSIGFRSRSSSGEQYISTISSSQLGGLYLKAGGHDGTIGFQDANGNSYAYVNNESFTTNAPLQLPGYTVATLPKCNTSLKGAYAHATDIVVVTYNTTPRGGGSNDAPVYCDGMTWKMH